MLKFVHGNRGTNGSQTRGSALPKRLHAPDGLVSLSFVSSLSAAGDASRYAAAIFI